MNFEDVTPEVWGGGLLARLMQEREVVITQGVPFISELPFFGELFRSHHTETTHTELIIFITPKIVEQ